MSDSKELLNPEWWTDERVEAFLEWLDMNPEIKARMAPPPQPITVTIGECLMPRIARYVEVDGVVIRDDQDATP